MIICAARLQQERAWAQNMRLAFHSTKAPAEHPDFTRGERNARQLQNATCDDHLCGKIATKTGMGPKLSTGISQHQKTTERRDFTRRERNGRTVESNKR